MAAITSAAAGLWSATGTWTGGTVPGNGDTVTLNHTVTVDDARIVGTSPATGGADALTIGTAGKLILASGGTLQCRGPVQINNTSSFALRTPVEVQAGGTFEFDASQATDPTNQTYVCDFGNNHFGYLRLLATGTAGSHAVIRSNSGGGNGYFSANGMLDTLYINATYCDFTRIGDATNAFANPSLRNNSEAENRLLNCILDACGQLTLGVVAEAANLEWANSTWKNTVATYCIAGTAGQGAKAGGATRSLKGCVFDKRVNTYAFRDMTIGGSTTADECIFDGGLESAATSAWASMDGVFIREPTGQLVVAPSQGAGLSNAYLLNDYGGIDPHFIGPLVNSGTASATFDTHVWETSGSNGGAGNGFLTVSPSAAWTLTLRRILVLPDDGGNASSNLVHHYSTTTNCTVDVQFCTAHAQGDGGGINATSNSARFSAIKNNLFWDTSARDYVLTTTGTADAGDTITGGGANVNYNASYNVLAGSEGKGYNIAGFTVAPGANDVTATDPQFVDSTRKLSVWDTSLGGAGTRANARTELKKRNESGYNTAYTVAALLAYVRAGFAPRAAALKGAASDGTDIGAVAVQSGRPSRRWPRLDRPRR